MIIVNSMNFGISLYYNITKNIYVWFLCKILTFQENEYYIHDQHYQINKVTLRKPDKQKVSQILYSVIINIGIEVPQISLQTLPKRSMNTLNA